MFLDLMGVLEVNTLQFKILMHHYYETICWCPFFFFNLNLIGSPLCL